jgi:hypothetical protein
VFFPEKCVTLRTKLDHSSTHARKISVRSRALALSMARRKSRLSTVLGHFVERDVGGGERDFARTLGSKIEQDVRFADDRASVECQVELDVETPDVRCVARRFGGRRRARDFLRCFRRRAVLAMAMGGRHGETKSASRCEPVHRPSG